MQLIPTSLVWLNQHTHQSHSNGMEEAARNTS